MVNSLSPPRRSLLWCTSAGPSQRQDPEYECPAEEQVDYEDRRPVRVPIREDGRQEVDREGQSHPDDERGPAGDQFACHSIRPRLLWPIKPTTVEQLS